MKNQKNTTTNLEYFILKALDEQYSCAEEIFKKLKNNKIEFEERQFYPVLSGLQLSKLLCWNWVEDGNGLPVKHYHLTRNGFYFIHK